MNFSQSSLKCLFKSITPDFRFLWTFLLVPCDLKGKSANLILHYIERFGSRLKICKKLFLKILCRSRDTECHSLSWPSDVIACEPINIKSCVGASLYWFMRDDIRGSGPFVTLKRVVHLRFPVRLVCHVKSSIAHTSVVSLRWTLEFVVFDYGIRKQVNCHAKVRLVLT